MKVVKGNTCLVKLSKNCGFESIAYMAYVFYEKKTMFCGYMICRFSHYYNVISGILQNSLLSLLLTKMRRR